MVKKRSTLIVLFIITLVALFILANISEHSVLGMDNKGYVTKDVYSHYGSSDSKIAIVTGMHPREDLSKTVTPYIIKLYALTHNVEIVNYQITVTDQPESFTTGRYNGENLVAQYVVPDVEKYDYNLVIICHDHEQGYGDGYYIATPSMDGKSVTLADAVHNIIPDFNYYQRSTKKKPQSKSIKRVDNPIIATGTPLFVYEIPEWSGYFEAFYMTYRLIDTCFRQF